MEQTPKTYIDFSKIISSLNYEEFEIPINQEHDTYFPDFLDTRLKRYEDYYNDHLKTHVDDAIRYRDEVKNVVATKINVLSNGLRQAIDQYYRGNVFNATQIFNSALDHVRFTAMTSVIEIPRSTNFYRTRPGNEKSFNKIDLFHNPFQNRHLVKTSRYSIPGFPALYLGSSIYVCWEEYDRPPIKNLYFSRFVNQRPLRVARIQRLEDFLLEINSIPDTEKLKTTLFLRYLSLFPLLIACTIRTKDPNSTFKPEYIIPQLLLQYISSNKEVDGIMFPSTKVNYNKIFNIPAYNYVFPVIDIQTTGYCSQLSNSFELTEPTSIELEELINHSRRRIMKPEEISTLHPGKISIISGVVTEYRSTSLGQLEEILNSRDTLQLSS